jgi:Elongation factor SelB, winged helix
VNPFADRHRGQHDVAERLERLRDPDVATAGVAFLTLAPDFATDAATVAQALNVRPEDIAAGLGAHDAVVPIPDRRTAEAYTTEAKWQRLEAEVCEAVARVHREQPLVPGVEMESLRAGIGADVPPKIFRWCVDRLVAMRRLVREDSVVRAPGHQVALGAEARALGTRIERLLAAGRQAADDARAVVEAHCRAHGEITAAAFRDMIGASRKFAIAFLDWCDRTGVTVRVGDVRKLRR